MNKVFRLLDPLPFHDTIAAVDAGWGGSGTGSEEEVFRGGGLGVVREGANQLFCPDHSRRKLQSLNRAACKQAVGIASYMT